MASVLSLDQKVNIPESSSGSWRIERFTVSEDEARFESMRAAISGSSRYVPAGTYTRLMCGSILVMSDTPDEIRDHWEPIRQSHKRGGHVLICGLGLGVVLDRILQSDNVTRVTVIEKSQDVINLVGSYYEAKFGNRLEIINADAYEWIPPKGIKYSVAWFDIWDDICSDNLPEMQKLHRKYGRKAEWKGSWCRHMCERGR